MENLNCQNIEELDFGFNGFEEWFEKENEWKSEALKSLEGVSEAGYPNVKLLLSLDYIKESEPEAITKEEILIKTAKLKLELTDDMPVLNLTFPSEDHKDLKMILSFLEKWDLIVEKEKIENPNDFHWLNIYMYSYIGEELCAIVECPYYWLQCMVYPSKEQNCLKLYCYKLETVK